MSYSNYNRNYSRHRSGKIKWKKIILTVLGVVLALALISGIVSFFKDDTKTVHPVWALGGAMNENYFLTDNSIYTKEMFPCKGLAIELDYGFDCMYTVTYYDKDGKYLGLDEQIDQETVSAVADVPENAFFARITLEPALLGEINSDGNRLPGKIEWYEFATYGSKLKITVDREQPIIEHALMHLYGDFDDNRIVSMCDSSDADFSYGIYQYQDLEFLQGRSINQIGIPVKCLEDFSCSSYVTLHKFKCNEVGVYDIVDTYVLTIPGDTYDKQYVNEMVYLDVDIVLGEKETLGMDFADNGLRFGYEYHPENISNSSRFNYLVIRGFCTGLSDQSFVDDKSLVLDIVYK